MENCSRRWDTFRSFRDGVSWAAVDSWAWLFEETSRSVRGCVILSSHSLCIQLSGNSITCADSINPRWKRQQLKGAVGVEAYDLDFWCQRIHVLGGDVYCNAISALTTYLVHVTQKRRGKCTKARMRHSGHRLISRSCSRNPKTMLPCNYRLIPSWASKSEIKARCRSCSSMSLQGKRSQRTPSRIPYYLHPTLWIRHSVRSLETLEINDRPSADTSPSNRCLVQAQEGDCGQVLWARSRVGSGRLLTCRHDSSRKGSFHEGLETEVE